MGVFDNGLHKTHLLYAVCILSLVIFWGFLGLGYLLSPSENIIQTGSFEYTSKVPRMIWAVWMLTIAVGMIYGAVDPYNRSHVLRVCLSLGALLCIFRGILTSFPYMVDLFSGVGDSSPASFGGWPTYWGMFFLHIGLLAEPIRNPLTEKRR